MPTVGRFGVNDIFDTNKFANNPKIDFLNWTAINAGTFDYAGDGWGYSYGAAAEWDTGRWTLRGGVFDLSTTLAWWRQPARLAVLQCDRRHSTIGYLRPVEFERKMG